MAFFEMHIKSDEFDCIPDVTKVQGKRQINDKNLLKSVHNPQGPNNKANTRMSLNECHWKKDNPYRSVKIHVRILTVQVHFFYYYGTEYILITTRQPSQLFQPIPSPICSFVYRIL